MSGSAFFHSVKEIVVGALRLHGVARERERSCQLQARHRVHGIDEHDASMIENPLELGGGFGGLTGGEVRQSANVDGIQAAETSDEADAAQARDRSARRSAALESPLPDRSGAFNENRARSVGRYMNCTDVSSGNSRARSSARARDCGRSPARASANAAA